MTKDFTIDIIVTKICEKGCKHVYLCIEKLKQSQSFDEISKLDQTLHASVLSELESIMNVYDSTFYTT